MSFLLVGSILVAIATGPWFKSYYLLLLARFLFGIGSESAYLALDSITAMWWDGKYLALSMSLNMSAARL